MANLKEIRSRISSVGSTMQITSAMKMVSAAKLKRAQDAIIQMRPYANKLAEILQNLSSTLDGEDSTRYSSQREIRSVLLVTITSNRGLCGGFNASIIKSANNIINNKHKSAKVDVLSIGKKSSEYFSKNKNNINSIHDDLYNDLSFEKVSIISEEIIHCVNFVKDAFDAFRDYYNNDFGTWVPDTVAINELINDPNFVLIKDSHYYENIFKYNHFYAGWSDAEEITIYDNDGYLIAKSPKKWKYREMRDEVAQLQRVVSYATSAIMLNHVVSMIDAVWITRKKNSQVSYNIKPIFDYKNAHGIGGLTFSLIW